MEFRIEKTAFAILAAVLAAHAAAAADLRFDVRHDHLYKSRPGVLTVNDAGISYQETAAKPGKRAHAFHWSYDDIQQLTVGPKKLVVLSYKDTWWKGGADHGYEFSLASEGSFQPVFDLMKGRLNRRLVAEMPERIEAPLWEVPVKHLLRFGGSQGTLSFGRNSVVYTANGKAESRTWSYRDIDNISSSGPYQLTLTTHERALAHYGSLKGFNFQLKRPLDEERYQEVWQRVNETKGLNLITSYSNQKGNETK
jgi:hypothetical protein